MQMNIPMISPVVNAGDASDGGQEFDPLKSVSQRLLFDEFSDEEMMTEEEEESDNSVDLFRVNPSPSSLGDLSSVTTSSSSANIKSPTTMSIRLRQNVTRKNLMKVSVSVFCSIWQY